MMLLGKACMCFNNNSLILWARCFNLFLGGGGGGGYLLETLLYIVMQYYMV